MSISIIGAGSVGMALGSAFTRRGESVVFGVPDPDKYRRTVESLGDKARVGTTADAIVASEVVILAVPHGALPAIAQSVPDWQGKILVDATNPLAPGLSGLSVGTTTSGAEELARLARGARVVKAFNTTGAENMADSRYPGGAPFMPVCADDAEARQRVMALATLIGFDAVDMGPLAAARYLEPFAMTWIHLAIRQGYGRNFAFAVLRRSR
ncbi:NADPH-dependent F420 reductase [Burkholderiaceae bacterium FT117]|uniref:NADPH-dependent F420 reductase n=1 Tax=Zeimonas sediminis TaxID=2944268 RepID=UPI002342E7CC|nr:NADPH-dependent F420 reductase [Zeimonas sediminis]MCM5571886.1 NADPH-dependent F420 reductase [Zeimonas sediminis]